MNTRKNEKGFTLIELIVVITIMGIISAVLIPQFSTLSKRARMNTDVSSVRALQQQAEIYHADKDVWPGDTIADVVNALTTESYLDAKYLNAAGDNLLLKTKGATVNVASDAATDSFQVQLQVTAPDYAIYNNQDDKDGRWIIAP